MPVGPKPNRDKPRLTKLRGEWALSWWEGDRRRRFGLGTTDIAVARERLANWQPPALVRREAGSTVYFFQTQCAVGFIKIGIARDVEHRLAGVRMNCPYEVVVLATMPGGMAKERELHERFAGASERGEWFRPVPELMALIAALPPYERPKTLNERMQGIKWEWPVPRPVGER